MKRQPKKNITKLCIFNKPNNGNIVRNGYVEDHLRNAISTPKTLEYEDIDKSVFDFVDNTLSFIINNKKIPTFTLYSNQRFSEYSQMWEYTDENGNLYLNFKTVNRDNNPTFGSNQGNNTTIPGRRKILISQRSIIDDNGNECYEIYSMQQPYTVDLYYNISFVTTTNENINYFNQKVNELFSSKQFYIRPNEYYIPLVIDDIKDETIYSISERKFFVQTIKIKAMAYIIGKDFFEVKRFPKTINIYDEFKNKKRNNSCVEIEEYTDRDNENVNIQVKFKPYKNISTFTYDSDFILERIETSNIRNFRFMKNDEIYEVYKGLKINNDDEIKIKINVLDPSKESKIQFIGYEPIKENKNNDFVKTEDSKINKIY